MSMSNEERLEYVGALYEKTLKKYSHEDMIMHETFLEEFYEEVAAIKRLAFVATDNRLTEDREKYEAAFNATKAAIKVRFVPMVNKMKHDAMKFNALKLIEDVSSELEKDFLG